MGNQPRISRCGVCDQPFLGYAARAVAVAAIRQECHAQPVRLVIGKAVGAVSDLSGIAVKIQHSWQTIGGGGIPQADRFAIGCWQVDHLDGKQPNVLRLWGAMARKILQLPLKGEHCNQNDQVYSP